MENLISPEALLLFSAVTAKILRSLMFLLAFTKIKRYRGIPAKHAVPWIEGLKMALRGFWVGTANDWGIPSAAIVHGSKMAEVLVHVKYRERRRQEAVD